MNKGAVGVLSTLATLFMAWAMHSLYRGHFGVGHAIGAAIIGTIAGSAIYGIYALFRKLIGIVAARPPSATGFGVFIAADVLLLVTIVVSPFAQDGFSGAYARLDVVSMVALCIIDGVAFWWLVWMVMAFLKSRRSTTP